MEYRLGREYVDRGKRTDPSDQFLRWINVEGSGMLNSPGIRPLKYVNRVGPCGLPAYIVLVTHHRSASASANPWDDVVDLSSAQVLYWGDAKFHPSRKVDDFQGNAVLRRVHDAIVEHGVRVCPPILHFSKPSPGVVKFNGLCVLERLELSWFYDADRPVQNYRAHLRILDCEAVSVSWLRHRALSSESQGSEHHSECPPAWRAIAAAGSIKALDVYKARIRSTHAQLPQRGSNDASVLASLHGLDPIRFERVIVALFRELGEVTHHIVGTKPSGDGGFDFFGSFRLQPPLRYEIAFRGEVKRYAPSKPVDPKDLSRLVARLGRREYGIYVTTSYFTKAAQREVISDQYPVHLIAGIDLVNMLRQLRLISAGSIRADWLEAVAPTPSR